VKILVFSDSHGNLSNMVHAVEHQQPDCIFHLGDGWHDAQQLQTLFPQIPLEQVCGNCDMVPGAPAEKLLTLAGHQILLCHGHRYGVKQSLLRAGYTAQERNLCAFLFGHTHCPLIDRQGNCLFFNPGSIGSYRPTYGLLTVSAEFLDASICPLVLQ